MTKGRFASIIMEILLGHVTFIWVLYESDVKISFILGLYAILAAIWFVCYLYKKKLRVVNKKKAVAFIMDNLFLATTYLIMLCVLGASIPFILGLYSIFAGVAVAFYWYKKKTLHKSSQQERVEAKEFIANNR